jgi:hypothetical protein
MHSAKSEKHSAKWQRELDEHYIGNGFFAEYFLSDTRQRLCRVSLGTWQRKVVVTTPGNGDVAFAKCSRWDSAKGPPAGPFVRFFAECAKCQSHNTRQRRFTGAQVFLLCRVLWHWHSAKCPVYTFFICFFYSIQTNKIYHIYITYITYTSHISQTP